MKRPTAGKSGFDDEEQEVAWRRLTRSEAEALRERTRSVSPWRVVAVQAAVGLVCAALTGLAMQSISGFWSALYGGAVAVLPSALLARGMTRGTRGPLASAAGFMFWEGLKVGVAIAMLALAVKVVPQLSWPALLVTMVVCIKTNWLALLWRAR